ncbi:hypothetical protein B0H14DRAFT_848276 [Mycena olivaceomarginata]|nr:hypothetical protein B0H14DRAFT_848276 [Mycena olivaceomarginata]
MDHQCIPANPDIVGIGVRVAIYAQNFLCFVPVAAHLWDGKISVDEMKGVEDQSIGMLGIAFAILISTIIQATSSANGQPMTSFHAAVILDLSWMNNTSTWIWFSAVCSPSQQGWHEKRAQRDCAVPCLSP